MDEALAATLDAPQTPAIQAKAAELDHDPVRIYQWVRNNIEFIPSYGSIQGAEYTLELGKGNAFDTASLLIALLRASDIPARYAMGTVRIPADQVMNWVGGVNVPSAAGNLMGQGGIPNTGLTRGGQISHFELEHIWVEAWIDFHPSRGADHRTGDTWVPMDASFKQYEYSEGMDLQDQVPSTPKAWPAPSNRKAPSTKRKVGCKVCPSSLWKTLSPTTALNSKPIWTVRLRRPRSGRSWALRTLRR
ncbi:transglutaminase domain-containing protein [Alcanivorax sp. IO_7]|nr:transglutaminase domain-containing protein [Alcanivorax sp. IO_7]